MFSIQPLHQNTKANL